MTEKIVPPNPYQGREVQNPDAYLVQMNRQLGENTAHLKSLMAAFSEHVQREEASLAKDALHKKEMIKKVGSLAKSIDAVEPYTKEHKEYVQRLLAKEEERRAIWMDAMKKVVSGSVWAGIAGLATLIGYAFVHFVKEH